MSEQISGNEIDLEAVGDDIVDMPDRLDLLLVEAGVVGTRTKAQKLIKAGKVTVNGETVSRSIVVLPRDFGTVDAEPEPDASEAANTQFRNAVWGLYEAPAREKLWQGGFVNPVES